MDAQDDMLKCNLVADLRQKVGKARLYEIVARFLLRNTFPDRRWSYNMTMLLEATLTCAISDGHHPVKVMNFKETSRMLVEYQTLHPTEFSENFALDLARLEVHLLEELYLTLPMTLPKDPAELDRVIAFFENAQHEGVLLTHKAFTIRQELYAARQRLNTTV